MKFAFNHMSAPGMAPDAFFAMASALGGAGVEIRNDLSGNAILDGTEPTTIKAEAERAGQPILSINALQRFNDWTDARAAEANELAAYAAACGAKALVLVPKNDGTGREDGARQANLRTALAALKPILEAHGIIGLVEPLGFSICSLRSKREAVDAIDAVGGAGRFKLVHDTFHHVLGGEPELFADRTGLVHISGVADPAIAVDAMLDMHRVLVDGSDRLDNVGQIRALIAAGYDGPFSFEPFAAEVHSATDPAGQLSASMAYIRQSL